MVLLLHTGRCYGAESVSFCSSLDALSGGILFCRIQMSQFLAENHGLKSGVFIDILSALITPHWKVLWS